MTPWWSQAPCAEPPSPAGWSTTPSSACEGPSPPEVGASWASTPLHLFPGHRRMVPRTPMRWWPPASCCCHQGWSQHLVVHAWPLLQLPRRRAPSLRLPVAYPLPALPWCQTCGEGLQAAVAEDDWGCHGQAVTTVGCSSSRRGFHAVARGRCSPLFGAFFQLQPGSPTGSSDLASPTGAASTGRPAGTQSDASAARQALPVGLPPVLCLPPRRADRGWGLGSDEV